MGDAHLCPRCLNAGLSTQKLSRLESHRILYDRLAFGLALYPLVIFYFTLVTAPMALFVAIRFRNAPGSLVSPWKWRSLVAIVVASLQILGWTAFFVLLFGSFGRTVRG